MPALDVGEPAPWFAVPQLSGSGRVVLDELAGQDTIVLLVENLADREAQDLLSDLAQRLESHSSKIVTIVVCARGDSAAEGLVQHTNWHYAMDGEHRIASLYGLPPQGFGVTAFVLSAALQVLAIASGREKILARIVPLIEARQRLPPKDLDAPVLIVPNVFDRDFCAQLIAAYDEEGGRELGAIEQAGKLVERFDPTFRKRSDWFVSDDQMVQRCRDLLVRRLLPLINRAFQFRTTRIERYLVGCYEASAGGIFRPHRDNTAPLVAHRRFAVTINLNDAYSGGELSFPEFGPRRYSADIGSAVVFSCSLLHEVKPLLDGTRYAFLTFLYDEEAQRQREDYASKMPRVSPA